MCGIFGLIPGSDGMASLGDIRQGVDNLFRLSETRGKEASGLVAIYPDKIEVLRAPVSSSELIGSDGYRSYWQRMNQDIDTQVPLALMGHLRLVTNGKEGDNQNNQPVIAGQTVGIHNGIITNDKFLWQKVIESRPKTANDSEALVALVDKYYQNLGLVEAMRKTFKVIEGAASAAVINGHEQSIGLATNTGSIYYLKLPIRNWWVFASEKYILKQWVKRMRGIIRGDRVVINQLRIGEILTVDLTAISQVLEKRGNARRIDRKEKMKKVLPIRIVELGIISKQEQILGQVTVINAIAKLKKHDFDYDRIKAIQRCSRCILPITTPFITFNEEKVCNYCLKHESFKYQGEEALRRRVEPYRSRNGEPDCLVGFSGGRDSSYGLWYVKEVLGLKPIAYTFDWGMLSDYGRQNAARVTGELGVEQIVVSAKIPKKLRNIRLNIKAWCKKPDLGMVPLFMAGDKQCEFYMNELRRKTGIKLAVYCRGNEYEKEEFKSGHCWVRGADPLGVMHDLPWSGKLQLAAYYGKQFVTNRSYLNQSLTDTFSAYLATYVISHDYLYLWHYIPWNEQKIVGKLKEDFNWQSPKETLATWRIDDGSPPFYNYIYYMVQGFTENDSLRSHQIRQGDLDRQAAWELACEENRPRYEGLQWYFDRVGLDGDKVLKVVDKMPKRY